jgi:signal transduction histidine kinase/ligand-binding sensor domain-containing protein/DNA-binding response OmpR family regulator
MISLALFAASAPGAAQTTRPQFVQESWTVRDGLPVNSVNAVVQSRTGFLWLATFDGLVRFDGVRFTVFDAGNTEGLPSNRILTVTEARDGTLWLLTEQRHVVSFRAGRFHNYGSENSMPGNGVRVLHEDRAGAIWLGTDRGLRLLRDTAFVPVAADRISVLVSALFSGRDGTLWVGTYQDGLFGIRDGRVAHWGPSEGLPGTEVTALSEDPSGRIWIGTRQGYAFLEDSTLTRSEWQGVVTSFLASADSTVWVGAESGVVIATGARSRPAGMQGTDAWVAGARTNYPGTLRLDPQGHVWYALGSNLYRDDELVFQLPVPAGAEGSQIADIRTFTWDREGSLWLGTNAHGLHRLKPSMFTVLSQPEGVVYRNVYPVLQDRSGAIWLGTWGGGMSRISGDSITALSISAGFPAFALSIEQDRRGRIWAGGVDAGVCIVEASRCVASGPLVHGDDVYAMHEDRTGAMWLGVSNGLRRVDPDGTWRRFAEADGLPSAYVRVFLEARDGTLWMGTNGDGIVRFRAGQFTRLSVADGLPSDLIRALHEDRDGVIWVGTEGRGLARIDPTGHVVVFRKRDGLFDEVIHRILEDDADRLWMSSNRGIFRVSRTELNAFARGEVSSVHSTAYTERDGLRNREANGGMHPAGTRTRDGRLWFPTQDGVVVVDPATIHRNELAPPVVIEQLTSRKRTISPEGNVSLEAGERDFEVDYTALSFLAPENVRFRYQLEGFNTEWVEAGARRTAFYTNVPPGEYTFRVSASNNDEVWNDEGAAVRVSIAPHFHETRTFDLLLVLGLTVAAFGVVRLRLRAARVRERELTSEVDARTEEIRLHEAQLGEQNGQLARQATQLLELDRAKSRFFANISHEFRTPLTLTIGPLEDLRDEQHGVLPRNASRQVQMALRNARRLLQLIDQILDVARLESGHLRLRAREADLVVWIRSLVSAFAPFAERHEIALTLDVPSARMPVWFDRDLLEKVVVNLLSNAFKFTPVGGSIRVLVCQDQDQAVVRVTDTGQGIPASHLPHVFERFYRVDDAHARIQAGSGIGLSLARELAELHRGHLEVDSEVGQGAVFTLRLPLGRAALRDDEIASAPGAPDEGRPGAMDDEVIDASHEEEPPKDDVTTVLIVDDNAEIRSYIRGHLARRYRVVEAAGGEEGITAVKELLPDLVVSDLMMPGTDGFALCRAVRADPNTDFVPIILLTARAELDDRVTGLGAGADDYIVKPFDMPELQARIDNLIASRRRLRERFQGNGASSGAVAFQLHADPTGVTPADAIYLERVRTAILAHIEDGDFGVAELARAVAQDRSHLYRRIRDLTRETPTALIRRLRIERAAQLLAGRAGSVAEIAYATGFNSVSYFCKCFRDAYGATPSGWRDGQTG